MDKYLWYDGVGLVWTELEICFTSCPQSEKHRTFEIQNPKFQDFSQNLPCTFEKAPCTFEFKNEIFANSKTKFSQKRCILSKFKTRNFKFFRIFENMKNSVGSKNRYLNNEFLRYLNTLGYYSIILYYYFFLCFWSFWYFVI